MKRKQTRTVAVGAMGLVALFLGTALPGRAQGVTKEQLELLKEIAVFFRNPANRSQLAQSDLDVLAKLHKSYVRGDSPRGAATTRARQPDADIFLRQMNTLSLEIYSRSNPGKRDSNSLRQVFRERFVLSKEQDQKIQTQATTTLSTVEKVLETDAPAGRRRAPQAIPKVVYETVWQELGNLWELTLSYCGNGVIHT